MVLDFVHFHSPKSGWFYDNGFVFKLFHINIFVVLVDSFVLIPGNIS